MKICLWRLFLIFMQGVSSRFFSAILMLHLVYNVQTNLHYLKLIVPSQYRLQFKCFRIFKRYKTDWVWPLLDDCNFSFCILNLLKLCLSCTIKMFYYSLHVYLSILELMILSENKVTMEYCKWKIEYVGFQYKFES